MSPDRPPALPVEPDLTGAVRRIIELQSENGRIVWFEDGPWDPWNHVECAMALAAAGETTRAARAYDYLAATQRPDGAWLGEYGNALPMRDRDHISRVAAPAFLDTNFCAYPAVGILHFLLLTGDEARVRSWWPMVRAAMDFVIALQRDDGTISWAFEAVGTDQDDALRAGNASIAKSLECAIQLAQHIQAPVPAWQAARIKLTEALRQHPERFDRRAQHARFAMDWYYPVLSGVLQSAPARAHLMHSWSKFVIDSGGCLCVADEPWITVAETAELAMAMIAVGDRVAAGRLLHSVEHLRAYDGAYWMGWQMQEAIIWPKEQPSWTQAAIILAFDALAGRTPGSHLLVSSALEALQQS